MANDNLTDAEWAAAMKGIELRNVEEYVDSLTKELAKKLADHLDKVGADDIQNDISNWTMRKALRERKGV